MTMRDSDVDGVEMVILPPVRDLGDGFRVRRALPSAHRRMVGPFVFFDQMGPTVMDAGHGLDVRPHPHIGLATVTYLIEGEIFHRDSLGSAQAIRPGAVNWMTAGSGIVHSERSSPEVRAAGGPLYGLQTWVALPADQEEVAPAFTHYPADAIPTESADGVTVTLIAGSLDGLVSPVATLSAMVYADVRLAAGARWRVSPEHVERAFYVLDGEVAVVGQTGVFTQHELIVLKPGAEIVLTSERPARLMLAGGEPFPEKRTIYWNFVSSRADRIEQAKADWRDRLFAEVPGESEFIPLPDEPKPVRYP
ncbi:pirin family protein [Sphingomonas naphthae]|uniref:Pirin family protein n=1 Tax=Sphingomonas naphthae TaxID=1813468 RepID=A0ABY7TK42_9SPHN|nr:pirin family protein [Sphingomonas naphthae]WCT73408.1 pirin family protein [Sphingomonas naphthae]